MAAISSPSVERKARGLRRAGRHVDDELHQALGADVALGAGGEDRHDRRVADTPIFRPAADVVLRECALVEVELHEGVVVFGGRLDQLLVQCLGLVRSPRPGMSSYLRGWPFVVLEAVHLHQQHVDEGVESRAPGLTGYWTTTGFTRDAALIDSMRGFEIGFLGIELVHHADDGLFQQACIAGLDLRCRLPSRSVR